MPKIRASAPALIGSLTVALMMRKVLYMTTNTAWPLGMFKVWVRKDGQTETIEIAGRRQREVCAAAVAAGYTVIHSRAIPDSAL